MIQYIGITNDNHLEKGDMVGNLDVTSYKWYWVDFSEPTEEEIKHLSDTFHFHPLAIEDCVQEFQRPKLDYFKHYTFFVTHAVREEKGELIKDEIDFFLGENFIISFHKNPSVEVTKVWNDLINQTSLENWDPYLVFYELLDKIVDNYFPIIYKIEDELAKMINNTDNQSMADLMDDLFETRNMLMRMLHSVNPMRDLLYRMLNSHHLNLYRI